MLGTRLRHLTLICLSTAAFAEAQQIELLPQNALINPAQIYEDSREDVTIPLASSAPLEFNGDDAISIPIENEITPMRCMTAWAFMAGRAIESPDAMGALHADFTEASAHSHWQHWLSTDLAETNGIMSADFHTRRLAAERAFSLALANDEEPHIYRTLGACYVPATDRQVGDPTILLRNFMIEHQGLPDSYAVPALQRQLRAFPLTETIDIETDDECEIETETVSQDLRAETIMQCLDRGGILASQVKVTSEPIDMVCRLSATVQCENIP